MSTFKLSKLDQVPAGPRTSAPPPPQRGTRAHDFLEAVIRKQPWREHAACKGHDPKHWHPEKTTARSFDYARKICDGCPVKDRCLEEAAHMGYSHGMWGGKTPEERIGFVPYSNRRRNPWSAEIVRLLDDGNPWTVHELVWRVKHLIPREKSMSYLRSMDGNGESMWSFTAEARGQTAVVHSVCRQLKQTGRATVTKTDRGYVVQVKR